MDLSFQFANKGDEASVQRLIESVWPDLYRPHVSIKTVSRLITDGIDTHVKLTIGGTVVAKDRGLVVGVVSVNFGWISGLCVSALYRSSGIGSRLLCIAQSHGGIAMEVHVFNSPARRFLEKRGWVADCKYLDDVWGSQLEAYRYCDKTYGNRRVTDRNLLNSPH
jgi:ribosomal protein S18 acetylase RimI-like enzyme